MTPTGLANVLVFPGVSAPVQGSPRSAHCKENVAVKMPTIVAIDGQARVDRCFAEVLKRKDIAVSVHKVKMAKATVEKTAISVIVELPSGSVIDPIISSACPTVEIAGREKIFARCEVVDIKVCDGYVEMLIKPRSAYRDLNWSLGKEGSLSAVWVVKVLVGDRPAINLYNQFHETGKPLRGNSESASR
jgi:hypothetical protein